MLSTRCWSSTVSKIDGGYFFPPDALRDTVAGWKGDHAAVSVLRSGMDELKAELDSRNAELNSQLAELEKEISKERRESRLQLRRAKVNYFVVGAVLGAVVGAIAAGK